MHHHSKLTLNYCVENIVQISRKQLHFNNKTPQALITSYPTHQENLKGKSTGAQNKGAFGNNSQYVESIVTGTDVGFPLFYVLKLRIQEEQHFKGKLPFQELNL